jgi:branched-chain amino acid aminotransferase
MSFIWLNGAFLAEDAPALRAQDRGPLLADGVFDTCLAVNGAPEHGPAHFARLARHAALLEIPLPGFDLIAAAQELLARTGLATSRAVIRTTLTRGPGPRGLAPPPEARPTLLMQAAPAPDPATLAPATAIIARATRRNEHSPLSRIKSLNYGDNILAAQEAQKRGAREAILLNTQGNAACAAAANIFIREGAHLFTPPSADGAMDGITRAALLAAGKAREETIPEERLREADAIYLTSSLLGIRQLYRLEDKTYEECALP